ncbi:hypothetical protein Tco_1247800 [Tanacetum coccineum]
MAEGADKPENGIIVSCLPYDIMESVISCKTAKDTWTDLVHSFEGPSDTKENRIIDLKLEYQTFRAKPTGNFQENFDDEVDERSSEKYLRDLDIKFHERDLLANSKLTGYSSVSKGFQPKFSPKLIYSSQFSGGQADPKIQKDYKAKYKKMKSKLALIEAKVLDDEEVTQVKVLMALADDELFVGKNHARNEQRLNLLSKYNKIVFELNKCRDELLILKQAKLDAVTFQIQNTELTRLNHALQEQLKEEKKINEKWLTSSKKVSQCISEQIPHQKKKVLGGELFTESS